MKSKLSIPTKGRFRLVKWDCEVVPEIKDPQQDPRCREIIEWDLGGPKKLIYKKKEE